MKNMKGWKTLLFAAIIALLGVLEGFGWVQVIPEGVAPFLLPLIAVVIAWLRKVTTTAMGKAE